MSIRLYTPDAWEGAWLWNTDPRHRVPQFEEDFTGFLGMVQIRVTRAPEASATNCGRKSRWLKGLIDCIAPPHTHTHTTSVRCYHDSQTLELCRFLNHAETGRRRLTQTNGSRPVVKHLPSCSAGCPAAPGTVGVRAVLDRGERAAAPTGAGHRHSSRLFERVNPCNRYPAVVASAVGVAAEARPTKLTRRPLRTGRRPGRPGRIRSSNHGSLAV
jgi:hypothetical protein